MTVSLLEQKSNVVFGAKKGASAITQLHVYGLLWNLCTELAGREANPHFSKRCEDLMRVFALELEHTVRQLPLIMPTTVEAASALGMAASVMVELCKPYMALSLSSTAASMVLSLGYHRSASMTSDTEAERQSKLLLFWLIYWLDTSFSVRLARAPVIQHHHITVPRLSHGSIVPSSFVDAFNYMNRIGYLQCQVVDQLYSPPSLQLSQDDRQANIASRLVDELQHIWDTRGEVRLISTRVDSTLTFRAGTRQRCRWIATIDARVERYHTSQYNVRIS
jgi:hypothetical protein